MSTLDERPGPSSDGPSEGPPGAHPPGAHPRGAQPPGAPLVDRAAALAAPAPGIPRRFVYWALAAIAVLGIGGTLAERGFSSAGLNPVQIKQHTPPVVPAVPGPQVLGGSGLLNAPLAELMGLTRLAPRPAPAISLVDQAGRPVSLAGLGGKTVVLTFFDGRCRDICPVLGAEIHAAETDLGPKAASVEFLTVNTDPRATAVSGLTDAVAATGLGALPDWRMLTGPLATLNSVWATYGITITLSTRTGLMVHNDLMYFIDPGGFLRYRATPVADESTGGTYTLQAQNIARWGSGIATYAAQLSGAR